jgi:hypothetical protein
VPQTNFNVYPSVAASPGQWADNGVHDTVSFPALVAVPFGVLCEVVISNAIEMCQPVQDATTGGSFLPKLAGVSVYDPAREQTYVGGSGASPGTGGSYAAGELVPCGRRGRIFAQWDGITTNPWPTWGAIQVNHSSTGAHPQGVFSTQAVSATVGFEIDIAPSCIGCEAARSQSSYTDAFGNSIIVGIVSLNLP